MPRARKSQAKAVPARRKRATSSKPAVASVTTLPPSPAPGVASPSPVALVPMSRAKKPAAPRDRTKLPSNSLVRQKVLAIIALRVQGKTHAEIAEALGLAEGSVRQYMWLAGRNGWLSRKAVDPTDRLQYEIAHKVVRNLDEMLDSDEESRRDSATMKVAEGMLFKTIAEQAQQAPAVTMIGVRVEVVPGASTVVREGTTGGAGHYVDGEVAHARVDVD